MDQSTEINESDIAVIGMAGRFPGASNMDTFWENLKSGTESISFFSEQELLASGVPQEMVDHPDYVPAGGVLSGIDMFDADFFDYSPKEASVTDPQVRLFLECAWEALETAGYAPKENKLCVGVYAGKSENTYYSQVLRRNSDLMKSTGAYELTIANAVDFLATRTSYKLNLTGPSIGVQTACSTSLVAVHMACQSLLAGECDMALAGGASVPAIQKKGYLYQKDMIASPDGHCRAFDAGAQGTVGGSGAGVVLLKPLTDALADRDFIYGVIKGSAVNNDGLSKIGYTAPSVDGQVDVVSEAQAVAEINPETITYIETHGTGTKIGDPVEIAALTQAFRKQTDRKRFCALGSLKTNIGHLDTAAGVAGLIKAVLSLHKGMLLPSLHFKTPNPAIDFDNSPFFVNDRLRAWETDTPRRAGVSSFGIGGTNAHVILEEAPAHAMVETPDQYHLLMLSAGTESALNQSMENLADHLRR
ncbi:MAG: polyketide synthase, partial [Desulfobacterales bacterium]|nr:polyketide synthase [Desulfobacterales bacterium]